VTVILDCASRRPMPTKLPTRRLAHQSSPRCSGVNLKRRSAILTLGLCRVSACWRFTVSTGETAATNSHLMAGATGQPI
jgi:hypothetical protein